MGLPVGFTSGREDTMHDKGIDYVNTPVEAFANRPVTPTKTQLEVTDRKSPRPGMVDDAMGKARDAGTVPSDWWR